MDTAVHCLQSQLIIFGKNEIRVSSCPTGQVSFSGRKFLLKNNFQNAFAKRIGNNTNFSLSKKSAFIADFFDRLKGLCVLQSPFFNKINPLGICETALWAVKCLRMFIKRKTAGLRNHLAQQLRVFQHGARAQVVLVERPAIVVRHEERRLQDFEQCFFADVGIGIVDEHARVGVAAGVDIQVYAEFFALRDGRNYRENKSAGLP